MSTDSRGTSHADAHGEAPQQRGEQGKRPARGEGLGLKKKLQRMS